MYYLNSTSELRGICESILLSGPKDIYVFYIRWSFQITQIQFQVLIFFKALFNAQDDHYESTTFERWNSDLVMQLKAKC